MNIKNYPRKALSSRNTCVQLSGSVFYYWEQLAGWIIFGITLFALVNGLCNDESWVKITRLVCSSSFLAIVYGSVKALTPVYCLRKEEHKVTWAQIILLAAIGMWLIGLVLIFNINSKKESFLAFSMIGMVLSYVFQDALKSVVAFFYLRINGLLKIGDWIEVKSHGIDGMLKSITLTTVIIENWDTTTSSFPTYLLKEGHFQNYQRMLEGKTHGRRMMKNFIIDTGWIHTLKEEDVIRTKERLTDAGQTDFVNLDEVKAGALNIELYRKYLYHWLMRQSKVTHEPRLLVRWLEQTNEGMPLQLYAFITETSLAPFEWQQSQIIEHTIKSLEWFDLQLYQSPSGYDASNSNIYLTQKEATYRKEEQA